MVEVVGHRGAAASEPENTLRSFRRAIALGASSTECDVHLTKDRRLVVIHDDTVDRTTNGTGAVREMAFGDVRGLDAGQGERVPTLEEVLETVKGRIGLEIELKAPGTARAAFRAVRDAGMTAEVGFVSFSLARLREVRRMDASVQTGALFGRTTRRTCERALAVGASFVSIFYKNLSWGFIESAHAQGLQVGAWSPDEEAEWRAMIALGVDLLATNRPEELIAMLRGGR